MYYFLNENIFTLNSGTEFSALKRLELFKKNGQKAKILTRNYNANLIADLERVNIPLSDVLNMYDFFQENLDAPKKDISLRYSDVIDKRKYHIEGVDANHSLVNYHGKKVARINVAPNTVGLIGNIEWFNANGVIVARDIWDRRGFKSSTQYFHPDGSPGPQVFFDLQGRPKLEIIHMNVNNVLMPSMWKLLDYKGKVWRFNSENQLFSFFLEELIKKNAEFGEDSVLINDRPSLLDAMAEVKTPVAKWEFLHNYHSLSANPRKVAPYLQPLFSRYNQTISGLIVATEEQRQEIMAYHHFKQVLVLPDSYADEMKVDSAQSSENLQRRHNLVFIGRIAEDKGASDALNIFAKLKGKIPDLKFDFYGYASPGEMQKELEQKADELKIRDSVNFNGYLLEDELLEKLRTSSLLLNLSYSEGFGICILKAMSQGVPVVAYDVKYGPRQLIDDGKNGRLVSAKNVASAVNAAYDLLSNPQKLEEFSLDAQEKAKQFSENVAWRKWQENLSLLETK